MATAYTPSPYKSMESKTPHNTLDKLSGDVEDAAFHKSNDYMVGLLGEAAKKINEESCKAGPEMTNKEQMLWVVEVHCLSCAMSKRFSHQYGCTLRHVIDVYTLHVCENCVFIDQALYPYGRHSIGYTFFGITNIFDTYGKRVYTIDGSTSGKMRNKNSAPVDTNSDNVYVSIWDNPKKIKTKRTSPRLLDQIASGDYNEDFEDYIDDGI